MTLCKNGTRKNKKTGNCEKYEKKIEILFKNKKNLTKKSKMEQLSLTKHNLIALGLNPVHEQVSIKEIKEKTTRKMSDKEREKTKNAYKLWLDDFITGDNNEIYENLHNIAKKKYSKDAQLAEFQEQFLQDFIKMDKPFKHSLYRKDLHNNLLKMREKVNK